MIKIIGAGMAGLLAGGMLRNECSGIYERQKQLPNNHSAVLRFRSSIVGDTLNIPFTKVKVMKWVNGEGNPVADALNYSFKTNGQYALRSSVSADGEIVERWIAPPDLINQMSQRIMAPIKFDYDFFGISDLPGATISTIPMPDLMDTLEYPKAKRPLFCSVPGTNVIATIPEANAYVSVYVADPYISFNRISLTGNQLIVEFAWPFGAEDIDNYAVIQQALEILGMRKASVSDITSKEAKFAKILQTDERQRKEFIMWATDKFNIYSLGRYATWRPGLLLDDIVNDVKQIRKMLSSTNYDNRK